MIVINKIMEHSKELELVRHIENAINDLHFDNQKFASAIPTMHRTLQQTFWRLIKECMKVYADENYRTDDRNRASHLEAQEMMNYLNENGRAIPMI